MRAVLIVLVVLGLAFAGLMIFGVVRHGGEARAADASGAAPPMRDGEVDKDALEDWRPPDMAGAMARLLSPLAPRIGFAGNIEAPPAAAFPARRHAPAGTSDDLRIVRVERVSGAPMRVSHHCAEADGRECPEVVCLCAPGFTYDEDLFDGCSDGWKRRRRSGDDRLLCRAGDDAATLVIYREGGPIAFSGLGGPGVARAREK